MIRRTFIWFIRLYQRYISPLTPGSCRFRPTCSEYMIQAVDKYGILRGGYLGLRRILRCHPLNPQDYDPVP